MPCTGRRMGSTEASTVTTGTTVLDTFYGIPIEYSLEYSWEPRISTVPNRAPITMFLMIFDEIRDFTVPVTCLPPPWVPLPWIARFCRFFTYFTCICIYIYILALSWYHLGSNMAQDSPKMVQDRSKMVQDSPKMRPKSTQKSDKSTILF